MLIEWKSILFIITLVVVMLLIIKFVDSKKKLKGEVKRKLFHTSMGLAMLSFPYIFTSALSVFILGVIALVLMYASAVFYPMQIVPANIQVIFSLNPLFVAIECFRSTLMYGIFPDFLTMLYFAVFSFMIFGVGFLLFRIHEKKLVLEL